jgi:hypothetical protein
MTKQTRPEPDYPPVPPAMAAAAVTTIAHIYREQGWSLPALSPTKWHGMRRQSRPLTTQDGLVFYR